MPQNGKTVKRIDYDQVKQQQQEQQQRETNKHHFRMIFIRINKKTVKQHFYSRSTDFYSRKKLSHQKTSNLRK